MINNLVTQEQLNAALHPVNSIYLSLDPTSPMVLFGGSWERIQDGNYLKAVTSGANVYSSAGLPNITGNLLMRAGEVNEDMILHDIDPGTTDGVFTWNNTKDWTGSHACISTTLKSPARVQNIVFKASTSNSIYGSSTTVTPKNYGVYMWKRTA